MQFNSFLKNKSLAYAEFGYDKLKGTKQVYFTKVNVVLEYSL